MADIDSVPNLEEVRRDEVVKNSRLTRKDIVFIAICTIVLIWSIIALASYFDVTKEKTESVKQKQTQTPKKTTDPPKTSASAVLENIEKQQAADKPADPVKTVEEPPAVSLSDIPKTQVQEDDTLSCVTNKSVKTITLPDYLVEDLAASGNFTTKEMAADDFVVLYSRECKNIKSLTKFGNTKKVKALLAKHNVD